MCRSIDCAMILGIFLCETALVQHILFEHKTQSKRDYIDRYITWQINSMKKNRYASTVH